MLLPLLLTLLPQTGLTAETFPADGTLIERPGLPGTICVFGEQASAVLTSGGKQVQAVAAVASAGEGRIFAVAHNGYLSPRFFAAEDGWMRQGLQWLRGAAEPGVVMFLEGDGGDLAEALAPLGYSVEPFSLSGLSNAGLLVVEGGSPLTDEQRIAIDRWLQQGGSLLAAICPWGWQQIHASRGWQLSTDMAANQILGAHGLLFTDGYADAARDGHFVMDRSANASVRCQTLVTQMSGGMVPPNLAPLEAALRVLPPDDTQLLPRLLPLLPELIGEFVPTPSSPLSVKRHPVARLAVVARDRQLDEPPVEGSREVRRAPGVEEFPGRVSEDAETVSWQVECDAEQEGWQSTGLYVDAGSMVLLGYSGEAAGWSYRIGAHKDLIWHKDRWPRWPSVSRSGALAHRITSPFGGLLYVQADPAIAEDLGLIVMGAYEAPWWRDGVTTDGAWQRNRAAPGPWAELQGKYLILTVPSASVRDLEDPAALMAWWDRVVEEQHALAGEDPPARPERFVADVLISAGYMHAGYPIMMHLDVADTRDDGKRPAVLLDLEELQSKGNWGCFHELGHNRQKPTWTFGGTGEVTNNLFSLHSGEVMSGITPWDNPWLQNQKLAGRAYLRDGADFAVWKRKPGIALLCYAQVQKEFGWEPFRSVFTLARERPVPKTDDAKRSFWVREMSLVTGRDLRPFHLHWGWPLEESLLQDVDLSQLDPWMPDFEELNP